ncbi:hypothetical protein SANTM175S_08190 [Streptomyces antimycoticus]
MNQSTTTQPVRVGDDSSPSRHVVVAPGMCSGGSLIFGQIGDWTWEAVAAACHTNVHAARTSEGQPAYLSFYYFHVRGGDVVHPHGLTFGDELQVTSRVFQFGSQSVITLHRLAPAGLGLADAPLDPAELYEHPHPDCLYAENFNRWIARSRPSSNRRLSQVAPPDFAYSGLPRLPNAYSPRTLVGRARETGSFYSSGPPGLLAAGPAHTSEYALDVARDLNGAGLVYFASYFSIFEHGAAARMAVARPRRRTVLAAQGGRPEGRVLRQRRPGRGVHHHGAQVAQHGAAADRDRRHGHA